MKDVRNKRVIGRKFALAALAAAMVVIGTAGSASAGPRRTCEQLLSGKRGFPSPKSFEWQACASKVWRAGGCTTDPNAHPAFLRHNMTWQYFMHYIRNNIKSFNFVKAIVENYAATLDYDHYTACKSAKQKKWFESKIEPVCGESVVLPNGGKEMCDANGKLFSAETGKNGRAVPARYNCVCPTAASPTANQNNGGTEDHYCFRDHYLATKRSFTGR